MKTKFLTLFLALIAVISLWASNIITYTATEKLPEVIGIWDSGLHTNAFNVAITSHDFSNGVGTITFAEDVTTIGESAFDGCSGLTSVTIPNSVTTIGDWAFVGCTGLTSITIPNSVTTIGEYAFTNVNNIVYNGTATGSPWGAKCVNGYVDGYLVYSDASKTTLCGCSSAATGEIIIPNSVTTIGDWTFYDCSALTSVTIPNSVTTIGKGAFYGCCGLTSIEIPNSVTTIGDYAFLGCSGLTSIEIPNSVIEIGSSAFNGCSELNFVTINSKSIVGKSYSHINNIKNIFGEQVKEYIIGDPVTTIGSCAFYGCSGVISVTIPNSVTKIGDYAFNGCNNIVYNGTAIGSPWGAKCVNGYVDGCLVYSDASKTILCGCSSTVIGEISIPKSVISIGDNAFSNCRGLTSVTIPNSVTTIGYEAFDGCYGLTSVTWNAKKCDSFSYSNEPPFYSIRKQITSFAFGNEVKAIPSYLCYEMSELTSITIPNSVTTIGFDAFSGCSSLPIENNIRYADTYLIEAADKTLSTYTIKDGTKWIGNLAFFECSKLTSVSIPNSVTTIGVGAFYGCTGLTSVTIPNSVTTIESSAFQEIYSLTSVTLEGENPPIIGEVVWERDIIRNRIFYIPCDSKQAYQSAWGTDFNFYEPEPMYTIRVQSNGNGSADNLTPLTCSNDTATLQAEPNYGYHFTQWSDGNTDNPRIIKVLSDTTFTAEFAKNSYSFEVKANDNERGSVEGTNGTYEYQTRLTISATARMDLGYHFAQWSDGNTNNPRTLTLTENTVLVAQFEENKCGNDLMWYLKENELLITGAGTMYDYGFISWNNWARQITSISLPEGLTHIGTNAFKNCSNVQKVEIPTTVTSIGDAAFYDCIGIRSITCFAKQVPTAGSHTFYGLSQYTKAYVLASLLEDYQFAIGWRDMILVPVGADVTPISSDTTIVTSSNTDVTITWPITDGTDTYTLTITKNGETVCVLTFNANGQLTNIAFAAPSHNGAHQAPAATLTAQGYQFTVTGLNPGTAYDYSVTATDAGGQMLAEHKGNFSTTGGGTPTPINEVHDSQSTTLKFFHNGNLIIERNGIKYTATGQKIR